MILSATQIQDYVLCPRRWAWRKLGGLQAPPNPSAQLGLDVHAQLEAYYLSGTPLDLTSKPGQIALAGLHLLPPPGTPGLEVESDFLLQVGSYTFGGRMDLRLGAQVWDHKTTKDFRWAKTPAELRTNVQAVLYARAALESGPAADLTWVYYRTRTPYRAEAITLRLRAQDLTPTLDQIQGLAEEIHVLYRARPEPLAIPPNPDACEAFGGCPYLPLCTDLTPANRMRSIMSQQSAVQSKEEFLARIRAQAGQINPPAQDQAPPPPPAPILSPDGTHTWDGQAWIPVQTVPAPPPAPPPASSPARGPGRPRKDGTPAQPRQAPAAEASPPPAQAPMPEPKNQGQLLLEQGIEKMAEGLAQIAEALRAGVLR